LVKAGSGIAQVLFHLTKHAASYTGKYQNQANEPVEAIWAGLSHARNLPLSAEMARNLQSFG